MKTVKVTVIDLLFVFCLGMAVGASLLTILAALHH